MQGPKDSSAVAPVMRASLGALLLGAVLLLLAGCGGIGTKTAVRKAATTSAGAAHSPPADQRNATWVAAKAQLTLGDLPDGWTTERDDPGDDGPSATADCWASLGGARPQAALSSPSFRGPSGSAVNNMVIVYADAATASRQLKRLSGRALRACLAEKLTEDLRDSAAQKGGGSVRDATTTPLEIAAYGDERAGYRLTLPVASGSLKTALYADFVLIRDRQAISLVMLLSAVTPPAPEKTAVILGTATVRLRGAVGP